MICQEEPRIAIIETSCQVGRIALARGAELLAVRCLDEARRHARDLVPGLRDLLAEQAWKARDLNAVIVSRGPGSYTGLRVGIVTAKTLAYATGCTLLGIETFAAIAMQAPDKAERVDVLADAQQGKVYVQSFARVRPGEAWQATNALAIRRLVDWRVELDTGVWISGPGVRGHEEELRDHPLVAADLREPLPQSLLQLSLERLRRRERDDVWTLEPLYLRPSAAEEKCGSRSIT